VAFGAVGYICWRRRNGGYQDMSTFGQTYQTGGVSSYGGNDERATTLRDGEEL
jgi:hypothetical protein